MVLYRIRTLFDLDITCLIEFHKQCLRQQPIPWTELPAWYDAVDQVRKPVRRDP